MRRIQLVLAALAIVVTSLAALSGPAVAQDLDCRDAQGYLIRCDGEFYAPYDDNDYYAYPWFYDSYYYDDEYFEDFVDEVADYLEDYEGSYWGSNGYW